MNCSNIVIIVFWLIVVSTHLALMIIHFFWSRRNIDLIPKRPTIAKISGVPLNISESLDDINIFINELNNNNRRSNRAQFWGYTAGFIASLIALILSFQLL